MSYHQWTDSGFGFELWNGDNFKDVVEFICGHESGFTEDEKAELRSCDDELDLYYKLDAYTSGYVANIINELEGTTVFMGFDPCGDTDQEEMIGVGQFYPWDLVTDKDKSMTQDDAKEILLKYMKLLNVSGEPEYFEAEYGG